MEVFFPPDRRLLDPLIILTLMQKTLSHLAVWKKSPLLVSDPDPVLPLDPSLSLGLYVPPPDIPVVPALFPQRAASSSARKASSAILATETVSEEVLHVSPIPRLPRLIVLVVADHEDVVLPDHEVLPEEVHPVFQSKVLSSVRVPAVISGRTGLPERRLPSEIFPPFLVPSYLSSSENMRLLIFSISEMTS